MCFNDSWCDMRLLFFFLPADAAADGRREALLAMTASSKASRSRMRHDTPVSGSATHVEARGSFRIMARSPK